MVTSTVRDCFRFSPSPAVKTAVQLAFISASRRFFARHTGSAVFSQCVSAKWKKSLLVSMKISPKARGDILDYKLTAYKCQAGSHGRSGATRFGCAGNIARDLIERLSRDNELNLFALLLYIDGLHPQVIKVTFRFEPTTMVECAIGVTFPAILPNKWPKLPPSHPSSLN